MTEGTEEFFPRREDFEDCDACLWHFDHFRVQDLITFWNSLRGRVCVNNTYGAVPTQRTYIFYDDLMEKE